MSPSISGRGFVGDPRGVPRGEVRGVKMGDGRGGECGGVLGDRKGAK